MVNGARRIARLVAVALGLSSAAWFASGAEAVSYNLNYVFSGNLPANAGPWGTITFEDDGANTVKVTMATSNLASSEFISFWGFNSDLDVSGLTVSYSDSDASATISKANCPGCPNNPHKADGDGSYEIMFGFETAAGAGRFTNGETLVFSITGTGVDASDFSPLSTGSANGAYNTAAHIQGIPGGCSGWVGNDNPSKAGSNDGACKTVAEPSVIFAVGLGLVGLVGASRRFRGRK